MVAGTKTKSEPKRRLTQTEASRRLGVCLWHLNKVLNGHRQSKSLTARYHELVQETKTS